jgi:ribonucleoside-diphosphate reductase alpha chain
MLKNLPAECYASDGFVHVSTNPCSELILSSDDSCRLISHNLKHLVINPFTPEAKFDFKKWREIVRAGQRLSDDLVELELEKLENLIKAADTEDEKALFRRVKKACLNGRRTGLGTHGLADALARLCLPYDSAEAIEVVDKIYSALRDVSYQTSVELAKERGVFPVWSWDKEKDNAFIKRLPKALQEDIKKHGRRNISNLTNAPTGSVSILSQTSSGLEPVYKNTYTRRKKINHSEENVKVDFVDQSGDKWQEFEVHHHNAKEWMELNPKKKLPVYFVESEEVGWERRIELQATMGKYIDHSISSTINLPKGTTTETVGSIYLEAWKKGCKGVTVYVDGSRSGVLVTKKTEETFTDRDSPKRPESLECNIHHMSIKGQKWLIMVGLLNGKPYEIFGGIEENLEIPKKFTSGRIVKVKGKGDKNSYDLYFGEDGVVKDVSKMFDNTAYQVHTRLVSLSLRHGAKAEYVVSQLLKDPDNDLTSFSRAISRVLKKYIEDGTKVSSDKCCGSCGQESLVYQDGCVVCKNCGYSKCS